MPLNKKMTSLGSKPMKSLTSRPSKLDSDPFSDNDYSFTSETSSKNKATLISPPANTLPLHTKTFDANIRSLEPTVKKTRVGKRNRTPIINTLGNSSNKKHYTKNPSLDSINLESLKSKDRKKKTDVFIYNNLGNKESGLLNLEKDNETDNVMKEFDVAELQEKSKNLKNELENYLESKDKCNGGNDSHDAKSLASKYVNTLFGNKSATLLDIANHRDSDHTRNTIDLFHKRNNHSSHINRDLSIKSLINNKDKYSEIKKKFEKKKPYIKSNLITSTDDIKEIIKKYKKLLIDILNGDESSFFYNEAKKLQQSSNLMTIKGSEIDNLPKSTYYGYIGAVRGFKIGKLIEEDYEISKLIKEKMKFNNVIKFWGVFNFTQYVLTPEILAHIVLQNGNLIDMDDAYDELEDTNEYGIYVTNTIELEGKTEDNRVIELEHKELKEINKATEPIITNSDCDSNSDFDSINISEDEDDFLEKILKQTKKKQ